MTDVLIAVQGRAGRITLNRPAALNALTHDMCLAIEAALDLWRDDPAVALIVIDGNGDRAFCAGGDIALMYQSAIRGDFSVGQRFWRGEYRMNAKLFEFPKPVVSFLHGFVMGGGVGVGCHASHRIVGDTSRVAMPECAIGLVPDVGGTLWLARAPGRLGEFLGLTGDRMNAGDAIYAGFADYCVPEPVWPALKDRLCDSGDPGLIEAVAHPAPLSRLAGWQVEIDAVFDGETLGDIVRAFVQHPSAAVDLTRTAIARNSPLSMLVTLQNIRSVRARDDIRHCLDTEYRFTHRAAAQSDFVEGVRAMIIDKDRNPRWRHAGWAVVPEADVLAMTQPLTDAVLTFDKKETA